MPIRPDAAAQSFATDPPSSPSDVSFLLILLPMDAWSHGGNLVLPLVSVPLEGRGMKLLALGLKELTSLLFLLSVAAVAILIAAWLHIDWDERFVTPAVAAIGVLWAWRSSRKL